MSQTLWATSGLRCWPLAIGIGRQQQYHITFYLLVLNFALDAVDGILARALHQVWSPLLS